MRDQSTCYFCGETKPVKEREREGVLVCDTCYDQCPACLCDGTMIVKEFTLFCTNCQVGLHKHQPICNLFEAGNKITKLVQEKNKAYGNAAELVTEILKILYPEGIEKEKLQDALLITRVLDKIVRIACGNPEAFDESPWQDIAGYGILGMAKKHD